MARLFNTRYALFLLALFASQSLAPAVSAQQAQRLDPNGTRLFLSPTARTMPQGQGRFSDYMVFFPSVAYGFTDRIDASVGVSILPFSQSQLLSLNVKAQVFESERTALAVGNLFATPIGEGFADGFGGTIYGLGTFGSARRSVTVGTYFSYAGVDTEFLDEDCDGDVCTVESSGFEAGFADGVLFMLGGETQLSNSVKLISENYVGVGDGETGGIISGGVRFFGDNLAVDLAFFRPVGEGVEWDGFPFVPYVSFAYNFGR